MKNLPEIITLRITSRCTQDCRYCYGPKNTKELDFPSLKKMFGFFHDKGVKSVILTGGEPLIRRDIVEIFQELKRYGFKVFLDTNGDLFFDHREDIDRYVDILGLPIDSLSPDFSYRGEKNTENVIEILQHYKNRRKKPLIKIGTVATKENLGQLDSIGSFLRDYPIDFWKIYQFIPLNTNANENKESLLLHSEDFEDVAQNIKKKYGQDLNIIISRRADRSSAYFIINPDGKALISLDDRDGCRDVTIGNQLGDRVIGKWNRLVAKNRYLDNASVTFGHRADRFPMKDVYNRIWELSKPYYQEGLSYNISHIEWMIKESLSVNGVGDIDNSIFLPLVILHDIGYAKIRGSNPFHPLNRLVHMKAGAEIASEILEKVGYPEEKIEKITSYISFHDVWAFGDHGLYRDNKFLGLFNDLDYIWMSSKEGFPFFKDILNKNSFELLDHLRHNEKPINRPFSNDTTRGLYLKNLGDRYREVLVQK